MAENRTEVEKLIKKAETIRQCHFSAYLKLRKKAKLLHACILIGSSIVAILTFADYTLFKLLLPCITKDAFTLSVGLLASLVFVFTVIEEYFNWKGKAQEHEDAGRQLTSFIRASDGLKRKAQLTDSEIELIRERYNNINENAPIIPDKIFLEAKKQYQMKRKVAGELDKNPFESLWSIKRRLKNQSKKGDSGEN